MSISDQSSLISAVQQGLTTDDLSACWLFYHPHCYMLPAFRVMLIHLCTKEHAKFSTSEIGFVKKYVAVKDRNGWKGTMLWPVNLISYCSAFWIFISIMILIHYDNDGHSHGRNLLRWCKSRSGILVEWSYKFLICFWYVEFTVWIMTVVIRKQTSVHKTNLRVSRQYEVLATCTTASVSSLWSVFLI